MRLPIATCAAFLALVASLPVAAAAGTFHEREIAQGPDDDSRNREYQVYVPDGAATDGTAPLVTILHGCRQTEQNMVDETRFTELADQHGFIVVFPFITHSEPGRIENCWGFWLPEHITEGSGEVEDIRRII
ncbi:MAG TPA: PHB depolymerase family esterase, partial [Paracoccaceae bacterium]|nr:PHB depolymerase family esterase [Paracoccaceae bacterium]